VVNGVGLYESDAFFDCLRSGRHSGVARLHLFGRWSIRSGPEFLALVRDEAEGAVKRLRHHPSLALWCGKQ